MRRPDTQRDLEIVRLYRAGGFTTTHIAKSFGLSRGYVLQVVKRHGASRTQAEGNRASAPLKTKRRIHRRYEDIKSAKTLKKGKSAENALSAVLRQIIIDLMKSQGRRFDVCEYCGEEIPSGKFQLHHTRYEGATFADLIIVCVKCNNIPINRYLD